MAYTNHMKNITKYLLFTAIVSLVITVSSCQKKQSELPTEIPTSGVLEYDIIYSGSIKNNGLMGSMLPSKLYSTYSPDGLKLNLQAGLGLVKLDVVATEDDSYLVINISGDKMIVPFEDLFTTYDYEKRDSDVVFTHREEKEIMAGYESECIIAESNSPFGKARLETYYVPFEPLGKKLKDSPVPDVPGFITAVKITSEDANIVIMLSGFEAKEVTKNDFKRPNNCKHATRVEVDSLIRINFEKTE